MVKLVKNLKVAELRSLLEERGESPKGRKGELKQRLSDWLEDNDLDPDTYDFETPPDNEIPGLESVPDDNLQVSSEDNAALVDEHLQSPQKDLESNRSLDESSLIKNSITPSRKIRASPKKPSPSPAPASPGSGNLVICLDDSMEEEDSPEIDLTEEAEDEAELEELNKKIAEYEKKIHITKSARLQIEEQTEIIQKRRDELKNDETCKKLAADAAALIKNKLAIELATTRAGTVEARRILNVETKNKEVLRSKIMPSEMKLREALKMHERYSRELEEIEAQVDLDEEEEGDLVNNTMPSRNTHSKRFDGY